ncbi:hypothetical protein JD969_13715 [Planctomycetota bacterium]|nr:hypothetical protein JD969_13715 [Planctomycetota bacterium]
MNIGFVNGVLMLGEVSETFTNALLILAIILIIASLMMGIRKRKMKASSHVTAQEHLDRLKNKHAVKNDLESLMVEIEELGKRLSHQIDAKTIAMERLLDEAELRIAQLNQLVEQNQAIMEQQQQVGAASVKKVDGVAEAEQMVSGTDRDEIEATPMVSRQEVVLTDHAKIYQMADEGQSAQQIAAAMNEHIGKIELILALRNAL